MECCEGKMVGGKWEMEIAEEMCDECDMAELKAEDVPHTGMTKKEGKVDAYEIDVTQKKREPQKHEGYIGCHQTDTGHQECGELQEEGNQEGRQGHCLPGIKQ